MKLVVFCVTVTLIISESFANRVTRSSPDLYITLSEEDSSNCPAGYSQPLHSNWKKCYKVNSYIHYLATQSVATSVWLGVECFGEKESCINDDNTDFKFSNFLEGEPKRTENCIYMSTVGTDSQKWPAFDCEQRFQFVCETNATPRVLYSCPPNYTEFQGYCYKIFSGPYMSRNEQSEHCRWAHGGDLVTISNLEINTFLTTLHSDCPVDHYIRIGLRCTSAAYPGDTTKCIWDDGEPFSYNAFANAQPIPSQSFGCGVFNRGVWYTINCNVAFMCYACQADLIHVNINE